MQIALRSPSYNDAFIAKSLVEKWRKAVAGLHDAKSAFEELSARLKIEWVQQWKVQEMQAMEERGECLRIYDVTLPNSKYSFNINF